MESKFYVGRDGQQFGPWTIEEILEAVRAQQLGVSDYLYDHEKGDWIALMAHPLLADALKGKQPERALRVVASSESQPAPQPAGASADAKAGGVEWFVLKDDSRFGPFGFVELVKMLQSKSLFEYDYVWRAGFPDWKRVAEAGEFAPESLRGAWEISAAPSAEVFFRRRHARIAYGASMIVHDNEAVYRANAFEISAGGASLSIEGKQFETGQMLYLHFKPGDGVPPFNARCTIMSKRPIGRDGAGHRYGVSFTSLNAQTREFIDDLAAKKLKAAA